MNDEKLLEQEILASFDRGEWRSVRNQKGEIARIKASATATLLKYTLKDGYILRLLIIMMHS